MAPERSFEFIPVDWRHARLVHPAVVAVIAAQEYDQPGERCTEREDERPECCRYQRRTEEHHRRARPPYGAALRVMRGNEPLQSPRAGDKRDEHEW
jgi:hypothetical protein